MLPRWKFRVASFDREFWNLVDKEIGLSELEAVEVFVWLARDWEPKSDAKLPLWEQGVGDAFWNSCESDSLHFGIGDSEASGFLCWGDCSEAVEDGDDEGHW